MRMNKKQKTRNVAVIQKILKNSVERQKMSSLLFDQSISKYQRSIKDRQMSFVRMKKGEKVLKEGYPFYFLRMNLFDILKNSGT